MAYEQRDNSGILFINNRKDKDSHPDRAGNAMIDGREYWVSGWVKEGAKGPFMTLAFKPKDGKEQAPRRAPPDIRPPGGNGPHTPRRSSADMDDEVPF